LHLLLTCACMCVCYGFFVALSIKILIKPRIISKYTAKYSETYMLKLNQKVRGGKKIKFGGLPKTTYIISVALKENNIKQTSFVL